MNSVENEKRHAKEVLLSIKGTQQNDGGEEPVELVTHGEYYVRGDKHYILYEEVSDIDRGEKDTKCIIKLTEKTVELTMRGGTDVHLFFEEGRYHISDYAMAMGSLQLGVMTNKVSVKPAENGLVAEVIYTVELNHNLINECHMVIKAEGLQA